MLFERTETYNFEGAFRGMRNPMNSWDRSDSSFGIVDIYSGDALTDVCDAWIEFENESRIERNLEPYSHDMEDYNEYYKALEFYSDWLLMEGVLSDNDTYDGLYNVAFLGPNDLHLAQKLIVAGSEHAKFLRQIFVSVDITAPLLWWKEFDTYKVGTVANSTSTMHKLASTPIVKEQFDFDGLDTVVATTSIPHGGQTELVFEDYVDDIIDMCENLRLKFNETGDKSYWRALIQILPSAYLQTRTVTMSYANLRNIYFQRRNHKLKEWHRFCEEFIPSLPYAKQLITIGE